MTVVEIPDSQFHEWDNYVDANSRATFFHKIGWKSILENAFKHKTYYFCAMEGSEIQGILPLAHVKSRLFGSHLISTPFCVYGGPVADNPEVAEQLTSAACKLAESLGVEVLEFRNIERTQPSWPRKDLYVTFRKELAQNPDEILKSIPRKQRAMVRKGSKAGLESEFSTDITRFYRLYSQSVRNLGTPVFAERYVQLLQETFEDNCEILFIRKSGKDLSGVMSFYFRDEILPYYAGSVPLARQLKANDYMYWKLMCHAKEQGVNLFDYGRSKINTGSFSFKKNWGFTPTPLNYEYYLVRATEMPRIDPTNPKYRQLIKMWKQLPLGLANTIGPRIAKYLG